jgi:hypothetical protein
MFFVLIGMLMFLEVNPYVSMESFSGANNFGVILGRMVLAFLIVDIFFKRVFIYYIS